MKEGQTNGLKLLQSGKDEAVVLVLAVRFRSEFRVPAGVHLLSSWLFCQQSFFTFLSFFFFNVAGRPEIVLLHLLFRFIGPWLPILVLTSLCQQC